MNEYEKKAAKILKKKKDWHRALLAAFGADGGETVWKRTGELLAGMLERFRDRPRGVRVHTDGYIFFSSAVYLAAKESFPDRAYDFLEQKMRDHATKTGNSLKKLVKVPGARRLFLAMWSPMCRKMFGPDQEFANIFYPAGKGEFRMDITKCPYHDYTAALGCPEIGVFFCRNDEYAYGNLPGCCFRRTGTLCGGADRCDFYMALTKE